MKELLYTGVVGAVNLFLFFSFVGVIGKTMKANSSGPSTGATSDLLQKQSEKNQDVREQQKRLMEERKRQLEDQQRDLKYRLQDLKRR